MATKKRQRRREKSQRHEYVYVDEEGNEVEPPSAAPATERKAATPGKNAPRGRRAVAPPTWKRAIKWAAVYTVFMVFLSVSNVKKGASPVPAILFAILLGALITPAIFWMHRLQYRTYLKMVDKQAAKKKPAV
jgi:hypothetical protein